MSAPSIAVCRVAAPVSARCAAAGRDTKSASAPGAVASRIMIKAALIMNGSSFVGGQQQVRALNRGRSGIAADGEVR
ncbi:hypothetical protein [Catellatospora paridis]|uniref:hypothetical protein n=1 Tax=Catellatospora paridis TaxID=1617086 RepID=UPI0012D45572|nr:hypothetical protein [Catellatospora paridis]